MSFGFEMAIILPDRRSIVALLLFLPKLPRQNPPKWAESIFPSHWQKYLTEANNSDSYQNKSNFYHSTSLAHGLPVEVIEAQIHKLNIKNSSPISEGQIHESQSRISDSNCR